MAHAGLTLGPPLLASVALVACTPVEARPAARATAPAPQAGSFDEDPMHLVAVWSPRAEIAVPLPDRRSWTVDDRTPFEVVATHAATASRLVVAVLRTDENVGRAQCEALARERHVVGLMPASVVEDEVVALQGFDTRVVVGVDPSSAPGEPLLGRVVAFGGARRKCFVFDFVTRVAAAADEPALSSRLAFVRTRILPGVNLDEATRGPGPARTPGASP